MAQVIVEQGIESGNVGGVFGMVMSPLMFLLNNWYLFVIGLFLAIAVGVIGALFGWFETYRLWKLKLV